MDIPSLSIALAQHQVKTDASFKLMNQMKEVMTNQGEQIIEMMQQSTVFIPHPTHGHHIDLRG